ncbi:MAG: hypothetical protein IT372_11275 [Polyangiaceae bacterium]|nr:hypothetical protein [Polyangiaceae bacterium]
MAELAGGCVRAVERSLGVKLDYQPETLPVVDHYLEQARGTASARPEALIVVAQMVGAYFGEVIRRRHASWWRLERPDDPTTWRIELEEVYLAFNPVLFVHEALSRGDAAPAPGDAEELAGAEAAPLELQEEDSRAISERLAELPPVPEDEYYAPSTRLEVIDIAVDVIRARRMAAGEDADAALEPDDYDRGD